MTRRFPFVLAAAVAILTSCATSEAPLEPPIALQSVTATPITSQATLFAYIGDITCREVWGEGWGCEYDNAGGLSPWDNPIRSYCEQYTESCFFIPIGGGGAANPVHPSGPTSGPVVSYGPMPPTCPADDFAALMLFGAYSAAYTWCVGNPLSDSSAYVVRVNNALNRLRARGGACAAIADLGATLVANNRIRTFPEWANPFAGGFAGTIGGALPANGGPLGENSYLTLRENLPKFAWDGDHVDTVNQVFLDGSLAHELSHLLGELDIPGEGTARTPSELACAW